MKRFLVPFGKAKLLAALVCLPVVACIAADTIPQPPVTEGASQTAPAPAKLPYGVADILKLVHAQVSDDVIVNFIQTSGTIYNLSPQDILYLRGEGVSDRVVNAMLEQRKKLTDVAAQPAPAAPAPQTTAPAMAMSTVATVPDATTTQVAPTYEQAPVYVQPAPSTVYVAPAPAPYYYPYPYYGPAFSFGFVFGGHGHSHGHGGGGHHHH